MKLDKKDIEIKAQAINLLDTDFKAEVIVSNLIAVGQDASKSLIVRHRGDKRNVSKDVHKIENQYSTYDLMEYMYIHTNRESIYDALPEGIFHQGHSGKMQRTQEDIIAEIKSHRHEEFLARRYFQPFEMVMDGLLVEAQEYEQKFDKAHLYRNLSDIFESHWSILKHLSQKQVLLFIKVIPAISEVSKSLELMAKIMGIILECTVDICQTKKSTLKLVSDERIPLGKWNLGINSVLGKNVESDDVDLDITIGPISPDQMRLFEAGKKNNLVLNKLIDILIPFERNTHIIYKIDKARTKFRLSDKEHKAYLGINTIL